MKEPVDHTKETKGTQRFAVDNEVRSDDHREDNEPGYGESSGRSFFDPQTGDTITSYADHPPTRAAKPIRSPEEAIKEADANRRTGNTHYAYPYDKSAAKTSEGAVESAENASEAGTVVHNGYSDPGGQIRRKKEEDGDGKAGTINPDDKTDGGEKKEKDLKKILLCVVIALVIALAGLLGFLFRGQIGELFGRQPETTTEEITETTSVTLPEDSTTAPSENTTASDTTEPTTVQPTTTTPALTTTTTQMTTEPTTKRPQETTTQRPPTQPTTVSLNSVVGQSQTSAESTLKSAGFKVQIQYEESVDYDPSTVIRQTPKAGTTVEKNSMVTIVVSTGKRITVTLDSNGGSLNTSRIEYEYNNYYSGLPTPSRSLYSFDGWYTSSSGGTKVDSSTQITTKANHTLYAHWTKNQAGDWTTDTVLLNDSSYEHESKTQYRYRDKQTTTSTSSSKSGWTQDGYSLEENGSGSVDYVASWPPGFDRNNNLYSRYNNSVSDTETRKYSSSTTIGYIYWHWVWSGCKGAKPYNCFIVDTYGEVPHPNYGPATVFEAIVLDSPLSYNSNAGAFECQNRSDYSFWWLGWDAVSSTQLPILRSSYTDYQKVYNYYKWGDWSSWSDSSESGSSTREVETRTMYRYTKK